MTEPCHVVGPALGAGIALAFAARHPTRVRRLAVSSPATGVPPERRGQSLQRAEMVQRGGMRVAVEQSLNRSYPERSRDDRQRFEQYTRRRLANDPEGFAAINRMLTEMDLSQQYTRITCPTLVIGCTYDTIRPPHRSSRSRVRSQAHATSRPRAAISCRTKPRNCSSRRCCPSSRSPRGHTGRRHWPMRPLAEGGSAGGMDLSPVPRLSSRRAQAVRACPLSAGRPKSRGRSMV